MKSITIHGIDPQLESLLKIKADNEGQSLNKTIKKILAQSLGLKSSEENQKFSEFSEFCGMWSEEEFQEFQKNTADLECTDPDEWS